MCCDCFVQPLAISRTYYQRSELAPLVTWKFIVLQSLACMRGALYNSTPFDRERCYCIGFSGCVAVVNRFLSRISQLVTQSLNLVLLRTNDSCY